MRTHGHKTADGADPSHSPTLRLQRFINRSARGHALVPSTMIFHELPPASPSSSSDSSGSGSPTVAQTRNNELHERPRLARFRFPPRERAARPVDVPDVFSPPSSSCRRDSGYSTRTHADTLVDIDDEDSLFNPYCTHKSGKGASDGASFAMLNFLDPRLDEDLVETPLAYDTSAIPTRPPSPPADASAGRHGPSL